MKAFLHRPQTVRLRRALFQVHLWIGVLAGLYVFVVCVTGAALVFRIDMQRNAHPHLFTASIPRSGFRVPDAHPAAILDSLAAAYPDHQVSFIDAPTRDRPTYLAYPFKDDVYLAVLLDPVTASVLGEVPEQSWVRTLQYLHFDLLGGRTGRLVNGIGGTLLLVLCMTGLVIWWQGLPNWRRGFVVDRRRAWTRVIWELHSATGVWTGVLIAMWAITGIYFVFPSEFRAAVNRVSPITTVQAPMSTGTAAPADRPTWRDLIDRARQQVPDQHIAQVVLPADGRAAFRVMFSREQPTQVGLPDLTAVYLDQYTGAILPNPPETRASIGDLVMRWAAPLHVGNFGGMPIRIAWLVLGLAPPALFVTGFVMWWTRVVRPRWLASRREKAETAA
jgi:uncharacterized iron-regulated membrane protein